MLQFEWDSRKAKKNMLIHGVSFDEASTAFGDTSSLTIYDPPHSDEEDRFVLIGTSHRSRLSVVVHAERKATKNERKKYEEIQKRSRHA